VSLDSRVGREKQADELLAYLRRTHKAVINALEWSRNGHLVATAGGDGLVRLFDIRTFKELEPLKGHPKEVTCESRKLELAGQEAVNREQG